jgi:hypothetical protein
MENYSPIRMNADEELLLPLGYEQVNGQIRQEVLNIERQLQDITRGLELPQRQNNPTDDGENLDPRADTCRSSAYGSTQRHPRQKVHANSENRGSRTLEAVGGTRNVKHGLLHTDNPTHVPSSTPYTCRSRDVPLHNPILLNPPLNTTIAPDSLNPPLHMTNTNMVSSDRPPHTASNYVASNTSPVVMRNHTYIKPETYSGETEWKTWLVHFNIIAEINNWQGVVKAKFMGGALRKEALKLYASLSTEARADPDQIISELKSRFDPCDPAQTYRLQLRQRRRKTDESLPALATEIRMLTNKAFPDAPSSVIDEIAIDHFVEALEDNMDVRMAVRRAQPKTLAEALATARFEAGLIKIDEDRNPLARRTAAIQDANTLVSPAQIEKGTCDLGGGSQDLHLSGAVGNTPLVSHADVKWVGLNNSDRQSDRNAWQYNVERKMSDLVADRDQLREKVQTLIDSSIF